MNTRKLIFAEKPSVMKKFVSALDRAAKATRFRDKTYYYVGDRYIFACAAGHLFGPKMPEEIDEANAKWSTDALTLPRILPLKVNEQFRDYYECLDMILKKYSFNEICVCTDPEREGQLIWYLIAQNVNISCPVSRVWIKEWTARGLLDAFRNRKDNSEYDNLAMAGLGRMQSDYIIGMTGTRVNTVLFGGPKNIINEGRVQSPTRYLVADLENTINDFHPETYYVMELQISSEEETPLTLKSGKFCRETAELLGRQLKNESFMVKKTVKASRRQCPLLYSTNDILVDASKKYGMSAEKTSKILQSLYQDYGLTTYPRTDIQKISVSSSKEIMKIVDSLDGAGVCDEIVREIKGKGYHISAHLIERSNGDMPHEAITPTYNGKPKSKFQKLSSDEKKIYTLICLRTLRGFYPEAVIEETKVSTDVRRKFRLPDSDSEFRKKFANSKNGSEDNSIFRFSTSGKMISDPGWMKVSGIPSNNILPMVEDGKTYGYVSSEKKEKQTTPPSRFTEDSLLQAMKNAGRYVENKDSQKILKDTKGIGTEATRSDILSNLYKNGFLRKKGRTIYPTQKCMDWMEATPSDSPLKSPEMTAELETNLSKVENGELSFDRFMDLVDDQAEKLRKASLSAPTKKIASSSSQNEMACPLCGKPIRESSKSWYCSGYKESGCSFTIWKNVGGIRLQKKYVRQLVTKGETSTIKGFRKRTGETFDARLIYDKETNKVKFAPAAYRKKKMSS